MTRKDYIRLARVMKDNTLTQSMSVKKYRKLLIEDLCIALKQDNSNFDKYRFIEACE